MEFSIENGDLAHWKHGVASGKRVHNELERSTIFNGYIHYFDCAIFNSYIKLPEGKHHAWLFYQMDHKCDYYFLNMVNPVIDTSVGGLVFDWLYHVNYQWDKNEWQQLMEQWMIRAFYGNNQWDNPW